MLRRETNVRLRDPITVRSTSSGLSTYYYYYAFGFFWIIFYPFPIIKLFPFYLITSPVPTCLVHNCETSRRLFYPHLLSPLSQDQIPFDPHHRLLLFLLPLSFLFLTILVSPMFYPRYPFYSDLPVWSPTQTVCFPHLASWNMF